MRRPEAVRTRLAFLLAFVLVGGCKSSEPNPEPPADEAIDDALPATGRLPVVGDSAPALTVLEVGAEGRVLDYEPSATDRSVELRWEHRDEAMSERVLSLVLSLRWKRQEGGGWGFAVQSVEDASSGSGGTSFGIGEDVLRLFAGARGQVTEHSSSHFEVAQKRGPQTQPSLPWLVHALIVPFPDVPIGEGARWMAKQSIRDGELEGTVERTYELTALDAESLTISVVESSRFESVGARTAGGSSSEVLLEGRGTLSVALSDPLAQRGELVFTRRTTMTLGASKTGAPKTVERSHELRVTAD